jgi:hypothetical protein
VAAAALAALMLLLAGCTGLPTSGAVYPGRSPVDVEADPDIRFVPDSPQPGASPEDIVNGFLRAGSGSQENWATARKYLTRTFAQEWNPRASVTVDRLQDRSQPSAPVKGVSTVEVTATGLVNGDGAYQPQSGGPAPLTFSVVEEEGEWRIAEAPDGIVLFEEQFRSVFRSVSLFYFDPSWQFLVPDVRWFPRTNIATYVTRALIDGSPSGWLSGAIVTAFPEDVGAATSVTVVDGIAQVDLTGAALSLGQAALDRMQAQLEASLRSAGVNGVRMSSDGSTLDARSVQTRSTRVDGQSLVERADGRFGFLDGDTIEPVADLSRAVESLDAVAVEASGDLEWAAVLTSAGSVARARADGTTALLDERAGLVAPTIDPFGAIWTVPATAPGEVRVHPAEGDALPIEGAWPGAASISAMQVSRDGARVAAAVTVRGHTELWVAGITRAADGATVALGEPHVVAVIIGEGTGLAWIDDTTVGLLTRLGDDVSLREQPVGGPGTDLTIPAGVTRLAGGNASARLLTDAGTLYVRQGPTWQQLAADVRVLAGQQGMP